MAQAERLGRSWLRILLRCSDNMFLFFMPWCKIHVICGSGCKPDPNLPPGEGLLYRIMTELSETEIMEKRRQFTARVLPLARDSRAEAAQLFRELQLLVCIL